MFLPCVTAHRAEGCNCLGWAFSPFGSCSAPSLDCVSCHVFTMHNCLHAMGQQAVHRAQGRSCPQRAYSAWGSCNAPCWDCMFLSCAQLSGCHREERCSGPHWAYSPWGSCSASCGGGSSTRQAVCMANASSSSISPASVCAHAVQTQPMQRTCNVGPCSVYSWQVTPWGPCNTTCDGELLMASTASNTHALAKTAHSCQLLTLE